jgi:predicted dithiol-disulfide oxidoreductase (DUF899 family)
VQAAAVRLVSDEGEVAASVACRAYDDNLAVGLNDVRFRESARDVGARLPVAREARVFVSGRRVSWPGEERERGRTEQKENRQGDIPIAPAGSFASPRAARSPDELRGLAWSNNERGEAMSMTFPGESAEYREARDRLLEHEIELRRTMEAVAAARRQLPPGGVVPNNYVFLGAGADGNATDVRLSELFAPGNDSLVIYNFMFPRTYGGERPGPSWGETALLPLEEGPCPSCVALLDQLDGAAEHAAQQINFAVVAKAPLSRLLTWADERGWRKLRLLSSAGNTYNRDYLGEAEDGSQIPMLNVFHRDDGTIRHFWGAELTYAPADPGQDHRSVGTLEPLWNLFDLTPEGRPTNWDEQLSYR